MRIGIAGPITVGHFAKYLRLENQQSSSLPTGLGGTPIVALVEALLARGHEVVVFTLSPDVTVLRTYAGKQLTIHVGRYRPRHKARDLFAIERQDLLAAMRADACEIIHAHWTYEFALAALSAGSPTLITIHDLPWSVLRYFQDMHRVGRLLMAYEVALRGKHFTAVSQDAASHFRRYFKPGAAITVIPNGLRKDVFELGMQQPGTRRNGCTFATVLPGWTRLKNAPAALEAFQIVRREVPDARLMMFGWDYQPGGPAYEWAIRQKLDAGVTFVGALSYSNLLKRVSEEVQVIVHPSLNESFSMVALEGMALRKAVIAGRATCGVREVLGSGSAGVLVDVKSPDSIAEAMVHLARDTDYRNSVAKRGHDRAASLYSLDVVVPQYEALYSGVS